MSKKLYGELIPQEYCIATVYHRDFPDDPNQCSRKKPQYLQKLPVVSQDWKCWQHEAEE